MLQEWCLLFSLHDALLLQVLQGMQADALAAGQEYDESGVGIPGNVL